MSGENPSLISSTEEANSNSRVLLIKGWKMQTIPFYKGLKKKVHAVRFENILAQTFKKNTYFINCIKLFLILQTIIPNNTL